MEKILLVEDDPVVADIILEYIRTDGRYEAVWVCNAGEALAAAGQDVSIILLDIILPGTDGLTLCQKFRQALYCPIIFVSSLDDEETIIRALQLGGDDYLVKPFKASVLLAKVEAHLRRMNNDFPAWIQELQQGEIFLSARDHTVRTPEGQKYLSPTEFKLLQFFMNNSKRVLELEEIYQAIWERPSLGDVRTVPVHVCNLRKKIEPESASKRYIQTVKHIGYWFDGASEK
jgi:DNA-binding response OmpR family regulator